MKEVLVRGIDSAELARIMNKELLPLLDTMSYGWLKIDAFSEELKHEETGFCPLDGHSYFFVEHHGRKECLISVTSESRQEFGQGVTRIGLSLGRLVRKTKRKDHESHLEVLKGREYIEEFIAQAPNLGGFYLIVARFKGRGSPKAFEELQVICKDENRSYQVLIQGTTGYVSNFMPLLREVSPSEFNKLGLSIDFEQ